MAIKVTIENDRTQWDDGLGVPTKIEFEFSEDVSWFEIISKTMKALNCIGYIINEKEIAKYEVN